jgi:hypothetical protein
VYRKCFSSVAKGGAALSRSAHGRNHPGVAVLGGIGFAVSLLARTTDLLTGKSSEFVYAGDWQITVCQVDYAFLFEEKLPMTNNVVPPQDFEKKCKQAEREHEARKLELLLERVKKQIEHRDDPTQKKVDVPKRSLLAVSNGPSLLPSRSVIFER